MEFKMLISIIVRKACKSGGELHFQLYAERINRCFQHHVKFTYFLFTSQICTGMSRGLAGCPVWWWWGGFWGRGM